MVAGLHSVVVFWTVLVSFMAQVMLLLLADIRRRKDWAWLKVVIWSAYTLADTAAIYALGHMSVLCNWSPEHQLMALWAPLLLVHLGGQDNITAYAIEDNRLWLRHLQTFVVQVAAAANVLNVSSILSHPMSSKVSWAAMLMFVVGVLKYGERIWALMRADSCASSSLSATSYDKVSVSRTAGDQSPDLARATSTDDTVIIAYSLLDVPKQVFEGPTSYVQINNVDNKQAYEAEYVVAVVRMQLWMMYDLLYTKAAVVHTWYGLCSRVLISLPFTAAAFTLFSVAVAEGWEGLDYHKNKDVRVTIILLIGAVVVETMSVLGAFHSKWTAVLLYESRWISIGNSRSWRRVFGFERLLNRKGCWRRVFGFERLLNRKGSTKAYWSGDMRQHSLFKLASHSGISTGSKMAKRIGVEDWWDSNVYSWSTEVPRLVIIKVLELVSTTEDITTKSHGLDAVRRTTRYNKLATWIWTEEELKLEERILVWHIATHVYIKWFQRQGLGAGVAGAIFELREAAEVLANYMFFLLAARPYMLPYPVSRHKYLQLCSDAVTCRPLCEVEMLLSVILDRKEALMKGTRFHETYINGYAAAQPRPSSMKNTGYTTLDRGCHLAAKLIHISGKTQESTMPMKRSGNEQRDQKGKGVVDGNEDIITEQEAESIINDNTAVLNMILEVWVEMLCYTAYSCNENYHAKHLTNGGEIMTVITLLMIYTKNGFIRTNASTSDGPAEPSSSQGATATDMIRECGLI